jgi:hypothetical protein
MFPNVFSSENNKICKEYLSIASQEYISSKMAKNICFFGDLKNKIPNIVTKNIYFSKKENCNRIFLKIKKADSHHMKWIYNNKVIKQNII